MLDNECELSKHVRDFSELYFDLEFFFVKPFGLLKSSQVS